MRLNPTARKLVTSLASVLLVASCVPLPALAQAAPQPQPAAPQDSAINIPTLLAAGDYAEGQAIVCVRATQGQDGLVPQADSLLDASEQLSQVPAASYAEATGEPLVASGNLRAQAADEPVDIRLVTRDDMTTEQLLKELARDPRVLSAEPNYTGTLEDADGGDSLAATAPERVSANPVPQSSDAEGQGALAPQDVSSSTDLTGWQWGAFGGDPQSCAGPFAPQYLMDDGTPGYANKGVNPPSWNDMSATNADGIVVVMDSGIDYTNPDLADVVVDFSPEQQAALGCGPHGYAPAREDHGNVMDGYHHGTHCAGIVGADWNGYGVSGVERGAKICAVALSESTENKDYANDSVIRGYDFMIRAADAGLDIRSVNRSFTCYPRTKADDVMIQAAGERGIVTCIASGNSSLNMDVSCDDVTLHQESPYVLRVNASTVQDTFALFTNYGQATTDLFAPGNQILSTFPVSMGSYFSQADPDPIMRLTSFDGQSDPARRIYVSDALTDEPLATEPVSDLVGVDGDGMSLKVQTQSNEDAGLGLNVDIPRAALGGATLANVSDFCASVLVPNSNVMSGSIGVMMDDGTFTSAADDKSAGNGTVTNRSFNPTTGWLVANSHITPDQHEQSIGSHDFGTVTHDGIDCIRLRVSALFRYSKTIPDGAQETCGESDNITVYLDQIGFGRWSAGTDNAAVLPFGQSSGTSMAAPFVTAAAAIVPTQVEAIGALTGDERAAAVVRAVKASVTQKEPYHGLCKQGGQLDLSLLAGDSVVPVLESAGVSGNTLTVTGANFGGAPGGVTVGGVVPRIVSWSDTRVSVAWPDGLASGVVPVRITTDQGREACRAFALVAPASQPQVPLFERDLATPQVLSDGSVIAGIPTSLCEGPDGTLYAGIQGDPAGVSSWLGVAFSADGGASWDFMELPEHMDRGSLAVGPDGVFVMGAVPAGKVGAPDSWQLYRADGPKGAFSLVASYPSETFVDRGAEPVLAYVGSNLMAVAAVTAPDTGRANMAVYHVNLGSYDVSQAAVLPRLRDKALFCQPKVAVCGDVLYVATLNETSATVSSQSAIERVTVAADGSVGQVSDMSEAVLNLPSDFDSNNVAMAATKDAVFLVGSGMASALAGVSVPGNAAPDVAMIRVGSSTLEAYGKSVSLSPLYCPTAAVAGDWLLVFGDSGYEPGQAIGRATFVGNVEPVDKGLPMHRLYNPNSGEHFYTANVGERDAVAAAGWTYEGVGWTAPSKGTEVYRLYNAYAGDHHYTTDAHERDVLVSVGWTYEGVGWRSAGEGGVPVWREYNPNAVAGAHNFTTSRHEHDTLVRLGWSGEGIAWYGI